MRTREQIIADLEARYAELEAEAQKPWRLRPCSTCRYGSGRGSTQKCREPLVVGFAEKGFRWAWDCNDFSGHESKLCGPEKALWQPKLTLWQRIINFLTGVEV